MTQIQKQIAKDPLYKDAYKAAKKDGCLSRTRLTEIFRLVRANPLEIVHIGLYEDLEILIA